MVDENSCGFDILEAWKDANNTFHFEMNTNNLEKVVRAIGYDDVDSFLCDNPGAQEAIVEWIGEWLNRVPEWKERMLSEVPEEDENEDGDEEN